MAVNVADLIATLRMDASQFTAGARQAETAARNLAGSVAASGKSSMMADAQTKALSSRINGYSVTVGAARDKTLRYSEILGKRVPESAGQAARGVDRFGAALTAAITVAAVAKVAQLGTALFNAGAQSEVMGLRYRVVFGDMTDDLDKWVVANQVAFGQAQDDMQGYLAQVANMLIPLGLTVEQSAEVSKRVLEMANAWSIWSGGTYSSLDAAEAVVKGLMGQTRGLIAMGMKIDDTSLQQALLTAGTADLTGEEKTLAEMQARLNLMTGRSGAAFEVAGLAMEGATGTAREMQFSLETLKDTIADITAGPTGQGLVGLATGWMKFTDLMLSSMAAGIDLSSWTPQGQMFVDQFFQGWMTNQTAESAAAQTAAWMEQVWADLAANPMAIPEQIHNALIEQLYGFAGGAPDPTALNDLFGGLAERMPGQAAALALLFKSVIGNSLPNWTPPAAALTRGAGQFALRLANAYRPKVEQVGENVVDWLAAAAEREAAFNTAAEAIASQFDTLPGLIRARWGNIRKAIEDLLAGMGDSAQFTQTITDLMAAGFGGIAKMLAGLGDSPEGRAAAAYLGEMLATAEGQAYLTHLTADILYATNKQAWAASNAIAADAARWAGAGAAAAAALAAGYDSYFDSHPLIPPAPGTPTYPDTSGGDIWDDTSGGGVPGKGTVVQIGMVIGDDTQVAKAVDTALRRAKQRGM